MNEEVLKDLYDRAVSQGYTKSIEEFQELLDNNNDVLNDNYNYVKGQGYQKSIEDFSTLVGVKKKDESDSISQEDRYGICYADRRGRSYLIGCFRSNRGSKP